MADRIHAAMELVKAAGGQPCPDRASPDPGGEQLPSGDHTVLVLGEVRDHPIVTPHPAFPATRRIFGPYLVLKARRVPHDADGGAHLLASDAPRVTNQPTT
jgi:hypothetical protein